MEWQPIGLMVASVTKWPQSFGHQVDESRWFAMARIGIDIQHRSSPTERFKALEHTKVDDLLAALPLVVWYGLGASARLSGRSSPSATAAKTFLAASRA